MSIVKEYEFHELSNIFPLMEGEEFDRLVDDIDKNGLLEPIVLFDGKILDGRNRYRACMKLGRRPTFKKYPNRVDAFDYVVAENIRRRHLNTTQIALIGEEMYERRIRAKQWKIAQDLHKQYKKERKDFRLKQIRSNQEMKKKGRPIEPPKRKDMPKQIGRPEIRKSVIEDLPVGDTMTISKIKKVKRVAEKEPRIAEELEKAKKGESSLHQVYEKAQIIEKLPEDLKREVVKEEPKITFKEAKEIAEIPKPELRKEAIKFIKKQKKEQEMTKDYIMDVAKGKEKMPTKVIDLDMKIINQFTQIYKQVVMKMTKRLVDSYNEQTRVRLLKLVKVIAIHIYKEFKITITGEIIEVEKS